MSNVPKAREEQIAQALPAARRAVREPVDDVDQASRDSFPASDPPPWNGVTLGAPGDSDDSLNRVDDEC